MSLPIELSIDFSTVLVFSLGALVGVITYMYVAICGHDDTTALKHCLEKGSGVSLVIPDERHLIDRPKLNQELLEILSPYTPGTAPSYYLITGEHGTGKTTAVSQVCREIGGGVIYVDIPHSAADFAMAFAVATGYKPRASGLFAWLNKALFGENTTVIDELWNKGNWKPIYDKFIETAIWYQAKHGKQPVLIIDNVNKLANENLQMLGVLQEGAKSAVDKGQFVTVFVAYDGMAPGHLEGRSASSRGRSYRIGDVDENEAVAFLQNYGLKNEAPRVFSLVGGRMQTLKMVAIELQSGKSFEDVKNWLFQNVEGRVLRCREAFDSVDEKVAQAVIDKASSEFNLDGLADYLKNNVGTTVEVSKILTVLAKMVSTNLLSKKTVTWLFHSNVEKSYFQEHPQLSH